MVHFDGGGESGLRNGVDAFRGGGRNEHVALAGHKFGHSVVPNPDHFCASVVPQRVGCWVLNCDCA